MELAIVIVSYKCREEVRECLNSVKASLKGGKGIVYVVDNDSGDGTVEMIQKDFKWVKLIASPDNLGFAGGNNLAIREIQSDFILLLNPDARLTPQALADSIAYMKSDDNCGVLGVKLMDEDGHVQPSARTLPRPLHKFFIMTGLTSKFPGSSIFGKPDYKNREIKGVFKPDWVVGAFFMIRSSILPKIGLLDDRYFLYFEELDFCLQARRSGYEVVYLPDVKIMHIGGASSLQSGEEVSSKGTQLIYYRVQSEFRFYRKNFGFFKAFMAAAVEAWWLSVIITKNTIIPGKNSKFKKEEARKTRKLVLQIAREEKLGKNI